MIAPLHYLKIIYPALTKVKANLGQIFIQLVILVGSMCRWHLYNIASNSCYRMIAIFYLQSVANLLCSSFLSLYI